MGNENSNEIIVLIPALNPGEKFIEYAREYKYT